MKIKINIPYLITVLTSVVLIIVGHRVVVGDIISMQTGEREIVSARVIEVMYRIPPVDQYGNLIPMLGERLLFQAEITSGQRRGQRINAVQNLTGFPGTEPKEVSQGSSILLISFNNIDWHFDGFFRLNRLLVLGAVFIICILIFGGKKGFNTLLSLCLICAAIFAVFIPAILSGRNIYIMALLVCLYTVIFTLLIVIGFEKKTFTAAIGTISGLAVTAIIIITMDRLLFLTGIIDEQSRIIANLPLENPINLKGIIFAGIMIGAMGAIMDVAMSISSSLWEIKQKAGEISFKSLFNSGITIGRDIMGTMANTLILAYIGSALGVVLISIVFEPSLLRLLNREMVIVEILRALVGSLGILFAMPLTAFFCALTFLKKR